MQGSGIALSSGGFSALAVVVKGCRHQVDSDVLLALELTQPTAQPRMGSPKLRHPLPLLRQHLEGHHLLLVREHLNTC